MCLSLDHVFQNQIVALQNKRTYWNAFVFEYVQVLNRYLGKNSNELCP